jgi:rod shape determining protein RodA
MTLTTPRTEAVSILQRERTLRPDLFLVLPYLALSALGIVMVYSASAPRLEALGLDPATQMRRHAVFVVVGIIAFLVTSLVDTTTVRMLTPIFYIGSLVALVLVLTPLGTEVNGAQRWIEVGIFFFQPSEFAKIALILALGAMLARADGKLKWLDVARALGVAAILSALIFIQPDLGTMLVFGFIAFVLLFAAGTTWRQLAFLVVAGAVGGVTVFQAGALKAFQVQRLTAFLDPTDDLAATALYNQLQSEIAIGSGGFFGKGLFAGSQTNLSFVPEQSTDFIFTAVGEQLGFIGGALVIACFALIVWRLLVAAANGRDRFSQLLATGVAALLMFHIFVNIGMTMRLMPVTGLPLPFLSAGGSAFIAMSIGLGLSHSVWMRRSPLPGER